MAFGLEKTSVTLDDIPFEAFKEINSENHYFAERVAVKGIFNFGLVPKQTEARIDLAANGITTPVILDSLFAFTEAGTSDEIWLVLYLKVGRGLTKLGAQKISAGQMPYEIPDGILRPDMVLGVKPTKNEATVVAYVKPVAISFEAVTDPPTPTYLDESSSNNSDSPAA